ncbi:DUF2147 domain-containing protein [Sphingomonas melonis]|uniref:Uncharacterized protein (DUF2147 family) n=1 Tax=Sphingomonas melonis TaxID=152682 RepID=A0A7Y9K362_9SPHN|nr:uncharacterized protein (DUF2147 family) [Sphingomonas melonis]
MILSLLLAAAAPAVPPPAAILGTWHNPKNSVAVRTGHCGEKLCGWVVRASDKAQRDVADKGYPPLIGTALLRDYKADGKQRWAGQIYVPDMGRAFGSTVTMVDANTLNVRGCLIGGFICKSQIWRRD